MTLDDPGWMSTTPVLPPGGPKRRNPLLIGGLVFLGLVVLCVVVVVVVKAGQSKKPVTTTATTYGGSTTSTSDTTDSSVTHPQALSAVLPRDIDATQDCQAMTTLPTGLEKASQSYACDATGLGSGAQVFAYQFSSNGAYEAALIAYNKFKQLDPSTADKGCPPGSSGVATDTWNDGTGNSGLLECLTQSDTAGGPTSPTYIWTIPADNAILEAIAPTSGTFDSLESWWHDNA